MREMIAPASPSERVLKFIAAFRDAPNDADIEVRIGRTEDGVPAIRVSINNDHHALMADEALKVADIMEETMHAHSNEPEAAELPNIILGAAARCQGRQRSLSITGIILEDETCQTLLTASKRATFSGGSIVSRTPRRTALGVATTAAPISPS